MIHCGLVGRDDLVLVGVDADRDLLLLGGCLEQSVPGVTGGVVDDAGAVVVHLVRQRLAGRGIVEGFRGVTDVLDEHRHVGSNFVHARREPCLELGDERSDLATQEAHGVAVQFRGLQAGRHAHQERPLLLLEREVGDVRDRIDIVVEPHAVPQVAYPSIIPKEVSG